MSEHEVSGLQGKPNDHITSVSCSCGWKYEGTSRWLALLAGDGHQHAADLAAANATIAALQADLAGTAELLLREQARAESQRMALATMREAMIQPTLTRLDDLILPTCLVCGRIGEHRDEIIHERSCILAQPDDAAAALAGAVLEAADRMGRALDALVLGDATPAGAHAMLDDYLRARAALRGHGAAEG